MLVRESDTSVVISGDHESIRRSHSVRPTAATCQGGAPTYSPWPRGLGDGIDPGAQASGRSFGVLRLGMD